MENNFKYIVVDHLKDKESFPMLLLGNKHDLQSRRVIKKSVADNYAKLQNMIFYETSAKNGYNIQTAVHAIAAKASETNTAPYVLYCFVSDTKQ